MRRLLLLLLLPSTLLCCCHALMPTAEIHVFPDGSHGGETDGGAFTLLATQALYGPLSPMVGWRTHGGSGGTANANTNTDSSSRLVLAPPDDPLLCKPDVGGTDPSSSSSSIPLDLTKGSILVVPRGGCTYERKTWAAQSIYQADGVIVYNTLASRYVLNMTEDDTTNGSNNNDNNGYTLNDIIWPLEYYDYDCTKGMATIPSSDLNFDQPLPYNSQQNDPLLSGDTPDNLCRLYDANNLRNCPSKRCLVAHRGNDDGTNGTTITASTTTTTTVCCAWDLHLLPYPDPDLDINVTITIPTVFITMQQADVLLAAMMTDATTDASTNVVKASIVSRWRPSYNVSSLLIWILGVFVAALAAFGSASDYHTAIRKLLDRSGSGNGINEGRSRRQQSQQQRQEQMNGLVPRTNSIQDETLQLEPIHALGFIIMASTSLFILFFFKIYSVVKVMYAIGCSNAVIQVIIQPVISKLLSSRWCRRNGYPAHSPNSYYVRERILYRSEDFGDLTNWDVLAGIVGYSWGITWLYMALFVHHSDQYTFFWVTQDIMGTCMCITFLSLIQLNSIQVATILLVVAFVYDIFFVFVTPLLFSSSVMITVATSGGPPKADPLWCEKYPTDTNCSGGDPLPMLLTMPRLFDYAGGASLLGLGDIVLPGLLLSFAARLDAAKCLVGISSGGKGGDDDNNGGNVRTGTGTHDDGTVPTTGHPNPSENDGIMLSNNTAGGHHHEHNHHHNDYVGTMSKSAWHSLLLGHGGYYFVPLVVAYAVGLFMANMAVYLMHMGQPALLYLVPCTLGTMTYLGWKRQELRALWVGPKVISTADQIVYGRRSQQVQQQQQAQQLEEGGTAVLSGDGNSAGVTLEAADPLSSSTSTGAAMEEFVDDETGDVPLLSTTRTSSNNHDHNSTTTTTTTTASKASSD